MSPRSIVRVRPRSLRGPLLAALALIAIVVAGMFATVVVTVRSMEALSKASRRTTDMTQSTLQLERTVVDLETGVRGYMLTNDPSFLEPYEKGRARIDAELTQLQTLADPAVRPQVINITRDLNDYVNSYTEPLVRGTRKQTVLAATTEGKQRLDALRGQLASLSSVQQGVSLERRTQSQALRRRMTVLAAAGAALTIALLIALAYALHRLVLVPVSRVSGAAGKLAGGRLGTRVPANGPGEIGQLGAAFNAMAEALAAREDDLRVQGDRLRGILEYTTTTISLKDREGRYLLVNDEWKRAMGQAGVDVIGRTDDELFPPDDRRAHPRHRPRDPAHRRGRRVRARRRHGGAPSTSSSSRSSARTARSTPPARWAPTSPSAAARSPTRSRPRARSPSSWPT